GSASTKSASAQEQLAAAPPKAPPAASPAPQAQAAPGQAAPAPGSAAPAEPSFSLVSANLGSASGRYRSNPAETTWSAVMSACQSYLGDARVAKSPASAIIAKNPCLKDLGVQVFDASGMRVWAFPGIKQSTKLILQSTFASAAPTPSATEIAVAK